MVYMLFVIALIAGAPLAVLLANVAGLWLTERFCGPISHEKRFQEH